MFILKSRNLFHPTIPLIFKTDTSGMVLPLHPHNHHSVPWPCPDSSSLEEVWKLLSWTVPNASPLSWGQEILLGTVLAHIKAAKQYCHPSNFPCRHLLPPSHLHTISWWVTPALQWFLHARLYAVHPDTFIPTCFHAPGLQAALVFRASSNHSPWLMDLLTSLPNNAGKFSTDIYDGLQ